MVSADVGVLSSTLAGSESTDTVILDPVHH